MVQKQLLGRGIRDERVIQAMRTVPRHLFVEPAGAPDLPEPLVQQLSKKGKLIIPVGDQRSQSLKLCRRTAKGVETKDLGECRFVKLLGRYGWPA